MEFLIEEKTLELSIKETMNALESASALLEIDIMESAMNDDIVLEASFQEFKRKAIDLLEKAYEAIKKFIKELIIKMDTQIQKISLNKKLNELKDIMAKKRAKALGQKITYFDVKRYKTFYTEFINRYTAELKKGLNHEFKNVKEYEKWRTDMLNKLNDFNFKLSDEEQWKLSISINSAIKLSETEARNREHNLKMVEESGSNAIRALETRYKKIDTENSFVNYNGKHLNFIRMQNSFISTVCSKLVGLVKKVAKFIAKHTVLTIVAIIALLTAL